MKLETIAIDRNGTRVLINVSDYDKTAHKLWGAVDVAQDGPKPEPVKRRGRKPRVQE